MVDPAITNFFQEKKAAWLKKNLTTTMSVVEAREEEIKCDEVFALKNWLPDAARRAKSRAFTSHPSKFTHPSTGIGDKNKKNATYVTPVICSSTFNNNGFVKTGNVNVSLALDSIGNAGELDVDAFLKLIVCDGLSIMIHLENDSPYIREQFADDSIDYATTRIELLKMSSSSGIIATSSKIKQVFFPVKVHSAGKPTDYANYHQLSILTASGIVFELRKRLDGMRFGDAIKLARDKKKNNQHHEGYCEIYNLTTIGYGGTQPQNISVLNSQNAGKAHMFMSAPPQLKNRNIHFPHTDFFSQTVNYFQCKNQFYQLHKLYSRDDNNMHIRAERDEYYQSVIDHIIEKMWQVRSIALEQYNPSVNQLHLSQKTWLCEDEASKTLRDTTDEWLDGIVKSVSTFLFYGYEKILGKKAVKFSDVEHKHIQQLVLLNMEALR
jgi:CRISPR-associated protein Csy1